MKTPSIDTPLRVAVYVRVSTDEQAKEGVSIDAQLEALRAWGRMQSWEIVREYRDEGFSGTNDNRPDYQQLLADARRGVFSLVVVAKLDRFMRNVRLFHQAIDELEKIRVGFVSIQEGVNTSDKSGTGRLFLAILAAFAEFESARIGERISIGKRQRVSQGKWASGRVLYGYHWDPRLQLWEIIEPEAEIVRDIYRWYVEEGSIRMGSMRIVSRLNQERDSRTRTGSKWGFSAVNRILTHPAYKGEHYLGLVMPPIVDAEIWDRAQTKRREGRRVRGKSANWLLQGLGACGLCGHTLSCIQKRATARRQYACRGRFKDSHLDGSPTCTLQRIDAEWLEKAIWGKFTAAFRDPRLLKESIRQALEGLELRRNQLQAGSKPIADELEKLKAKKERLALVFADGAINRELYNRKLDELRRQEASLQHRMANLNPEARAELSELEKWIPVVENMRSQPFLETFVTPSGIYATQISPEDEKVYTVPLGFNIGENLKRQLGNVDVNTVTDKGVLDAMLPTELWEQENLRELLTQNKREILRAFGVKVHAYPDRIEVKGFIPDQVVKFIGTHNYGGRDTQSDCLSG